MNQDELMTWAYAVQEHMNALDRLIEDRKLLKSLMEKHLREFFNFSEIEFNRDFSVITLSGFESNHIKTEKISELLMDWEVKVNYDSYGIDSVVIEVYPMGVPNEEGEL